MSHCYLGRWIISATKLSEDDFLGLLNTLQRILNLPVTSLCPVTINQVDTRPNRQGLHHAVESIQCSPNHAVTTADGHVSVLEGTSNISTSS